MILIRGRGRGNWRAVGNGVMSLNYEVCGSVPADGLFIYANTLPCHDQVSLAVGIMPVDAERRYTYTKLGRFSLSG